MSATSAVPSSLAVPGGSPIGHGRFRSLKATLISFGLFAVAWQIASLVLPAFMVPGWQRIARALASLPFEFVAISLARVVVALTISFVFGILGALAMYRWEPVERYSMPLVRLVMAVPATVWIVVSVLWFKWVELRICSVLFVVCGPIFLVDFLDGMRAVSKDLRDMMWSFRPGLIQFLVKLVIPAILPTVLTSFKINLGQAIRLVTFAELVGAVSGIGYGLTVAEENFAIADVFAWAAILVVVLHFVMEGLARLEAHVLRWRV